MIEIFKTIIWGCVAIWAISIAFRALLQIALATVKFIIEVMEGGND